MMPDACLAVVVPCFNEVATVRGLLERVLASPHVAEIVVVDDGSTDGTRDILRSFEGHPVIRVVLQPFNQGKGAALRRGFEEVTAPYVVIQDADLEYDPAEYSRLLEPLLDGRADVVYGSRFLPVGAHRVLYYWHSVGNRLLTKASNMATNLNLSDMETCYKVFRREVVQSLDLRESRFGFEPEVTARVAEGRWKVYEVGISYDGRTYAEGKKIGWRDGVRALYCIARYSPPVTRIEKRNLAKRPSPASFAQADNELAGVLHSLSDAHRYADWLAELIRPHLGKEVVEIGAGQGTMTMRLAGNGAAVVATDPSERAVLTLREQFADRANVTVEKGDVATVAARHPADTYVLINVLEHIADDVAALRQLREGLNPDGRVVLFVPAFESLYSRFDAQVGHYRRYRRSTLATALSRSGLVPEELHYVNSLGAPTWLVFARLFGGQPTARRPAIAYDRAAVPLLRALESKHKPPFGQSIFCVARSA